MIEAIEASERGAAYLDKKFPGWHLWVPPGFDMLNCFDCVGAHIAKHETSVKGYSFFLDFTGLSEQEAKELGFDADTTHPDGFGELTQAWQDRIAERRVAWQPNYTG